MNSGDEKERIKILVAEPEARNAAELAHKLEGLGFAVCARAASGEEVLALAEEHQPDLVLTEIVLPGELDGLMTAERLFQKWGVPVVFLASDETADRLENAKFSYPFRYLLKPVRDRDLKITLNMALYTAGLETARREAEKRTLHLNRVLKAVRNVEQIIVSETDPNRLIQRSCQNLTETMGYFNAWIALFDENRFAVINTAASGFNGGFRIMDEQLRQGLLPVCFRRALDQDEPFIVSDPGSECPGCPLARGYAGRVGMTGRLDYGGETYGILSVSVPFEYAFDKEEYELFREVAEDLAYALHKIELEEQGRRLNHIVATAHSPMSLVSRDYRYLAVNSAYADFYGVETDRIVGKTVAEFCGASTFEQEIKPHLDRCLSGRSLKYEIPVDFPGKGLRWMEMSYNPYRGPDGEVFGVVSHGFDITDRKRAEEALRESERKWRNILVDVPQIGITLAPNADIIFANQYFLKLTGRREEEVINRNWFDLFIPEDCREEVRHVFQTVMNSRATKGFSSFENEIVNREGERLNVVWSNVLTKDFSGNVVDVTCLGVDVTERKKAEDALRKSEEKYRQLVDNAQEAIFVAQGGGLKFANPKAHEIVGFSIDEITSRPFTDFIHPDDRSLVYERHVQRLKGLDLPSTYEFRVVARSGEIKWVEMKTVLINWEGEPATLNFLSDISDRKQKEEVLHFQAELLEEIQDHVTATDLDGNIVFLNNVVLRSLGYSREELLGKSVMELGEDPEHGATQKQIIKNTLEHGQWRGEVVNTGADGEEIIFDCRTKLIRDRQGRPFSMLGVSTDITERKLAEQALRESEERFRGVFATSPIGIAIVNTADQRFLQANTSYLELVGYTEDELRELTVADITDPDDWKIETDMIAGYFEKKLPEYELIKRYICKDGEVRFVQVTGDVLHLHGGEPPLAVANVIDVTQRLKAEQEKEALQTQLQQAQKMEAIGTLAGGVAHDFNNLLQAINGYTQLLLLDKSKTDPEFSSLAAIQDAGLRASELVRQLLLFSRKADSTRKPIKIHHQVEQAARMLKRTIPKMINIEITAGEGLWTVNADPVQMEQMLLNLGTNAADAMPDGGELAFQIENRTLDDEAGGRPLGVPAGRYVLLKVSDTGHGMDQETREKIFEPFFTTKDFGKGTGLGLASVYGIVKSHGGFIECRSEVNRGTIFEIYFPALQEPEPQSRGKLEPRSIPGGGETVLLVDDEEAIRGFAQQALIKFGYQTMIASSGEEALELYAERPNEIDLVVMDLGMPGMGGHKCLQELLRIDPEVRVIIASGYSIEGQVRRSMEIGALGYVAKPYQLSDLLNVVREVLDRQGRGLGNFGKKPG